MIQQAKFTLILFLVKLFKRKKKKKNKKKKKQKNNWRPRKQIDALKDLKDSEKKNQKKTTTQYMLMIIRINY